MGWYYGNNESRAQTVANRISPYDEELGGRVTCLRHALIGNCLWKVMERTREGQETIRWIGLDLLGQADGCGWGVKPMTESCGPFYYTCPLAYLDMAPEGNADWRSKVRRHHSEKKRISDLLKALRPGMTVTLQNAIIPHARIHRLKPLCGYHEGTLYRLTRSMLGEIVEEGAQV